MSRVQSIERAFAVLGALADGPIGVTEVADRVDLPKSTAARLLASLAREGVVEQVPGDTRYRLGPRLVTLAARIRPVRTLAGLARPSLEELVGDGRRGGRALSVRDGDDGPLHRPGRQPEPGVRARLDRVADPAARRLVRPGPARLRGADVRPALPRPADGAVHAADPRHRRRAARADARDPARRLHVGARGVRRGHLVGRGAGRRRVGRGRGGGPSARAVVPVPGAGGERPLAELVVGSAARITESLRQAG